MMGSRHLPLPPLYWDGQRAERQRYDSVPDRYSRPSDFYLGFEELNLDGRGRTIVDVRTGPRYLDPRASLPRTYHLDSTIPRSDHRGRGPRLRSAMSGRRSSMSFGKGMKKLQKVLQSSGEFFGEFIRKFDGDMAAIAGYTTVKIQEELWRLKIIGKKDKNATRESQNQNQHQGYPEDEEGEDDGEKPKKKFEERGKDLTQALEVALDVQFEDKRNMVPARLKARMDAAASLQDKIRVASNQIIRLLDDATKDRDQCNNLLNEIHQLKTLLESETERNKELFKDDDKDGSSDAGDEGRGWDN